jgi:hypothetical protein
MAYVGFCSSMHHNVLRIKEEDEDRLQPLANHMQLEGSQSSAYLRGATPEPEDRSMPVPMYTGATKPVYGPKPQTLRRTRAYEDLTCGRVRYNTDRMLNGYRGDANSQARKPFQFRIIRASKLRNACTMKALQSSLTQLTVDGNPSNGHTQGLVIHKHRSRREGFPLDKSDLRVQVLKKRAMATKQTKRVRSKRRSRA